MRKTTVAALALAASLAFVTGCGGEDEPEGAAPAQARVTIKTFDFQPDPLTVKAGTTVTFENSDQILHTVTSGPRDAPDGAFDADLADAGSSFEHTFETPGTYEYFCKVHPGDGMEGVVTVE